MINKIMLKEVNDIKVSVVQFKDYVWLNEPSFEVAIIDADDVKDVGRYYTEAEAVAKAEEIIAQASIETVEAEIIAPVLSADEFTAILEAYEITIDKLQYDQKLLAKSVSGALADTVHEYMIKYHGAFYDDSIHLVHMEKYLDLTMYKQNIYNTEFNKFFSYWIPKAII